MKICVIILALIAQALSKKKGQARSHKQIFTNSTNIATFPNTETDFSENLIFFYLTPWFTWEKLYMFYIFNNQEKIKQMVIQLNNRAPIFYTLSLQFKGPKIAGTNS